MADKKDVNKTIDKKSTDSKAAEGAIQGTNIAVAKKRKIFIIAGAGGILLLCAAIGAFFLMKSHAHHPQPVESIPVDPNADLKDENGHDSSASAGDKKSGSPQSARATAMANDARSEPGKDDHGGTQKDDHGGAQKDDHGGAQKDDHGGAQKDDHADPHAKAGAPAEKEKPEGTKNFGNTFHIPKLELNLGNPIENRYLRIGISIEYRGNEEQTEELKKREAQLKDIVITSVTTKSRAQLLSENGKELLRREMLNKINEVVDKPVQNIFYTEFLVE